MSIRSDGKKDKNKKKHLLINVWDRWKKIARKIGDFNARVILTIFYFVLLLPFALLIKLLTDPLDIKKGSPRGWRVKEEDPDVSPMDKAVRQF
jgi:hypothetical protein